MSLTNIELCTRTMETVKMLVLKTEDANKNQTNVNWKEKGLTKLIILIRKQESYICIIYMK